MSGSRLATGGLIDRDKPLEFRFDGKAYTGYAGDTVASALLASGVKVLGRSFKYHRPRGLWGAWIDDPNAIMNIRLGGDEIPNCQASTTPLLDGMVARAVNAWPSARNDIKGGLDLIAHRWLAAGFYYKTFMWPDWHLFEPLIRKTAGLGRVHPDVIDDFVADQLNDDCDTLVVGGGAAGLTAARKAAEAGQKVLLVDDHPEPGGGLYRRGGEIEGSAPADWVVAQVDAIEAAGGQVLTRTTAFGVYDHGLIGLIEDRGFAVGPRLWRLRAGRMILAAGAIDRPLTFANNDKPGVMSVEAACEFLGRYSVLVAKDIVLASNNSFGDHAADLLTRAGAKITMIDPDDGPLAAYGLRTLRSVVQNGRTHGADVLLTSAGWTPLVHLWRHAGGRLEWSEEHATFLPGGAPEAMVAVGAANGTFDQDQALDEARAAGTGADWERATSSYTVTPHLPVPGTPGRQWIDFQHDVTLEDVELAARENFMSIEHLKRYTTLGMAVDQGKTSNIAGLAAMAAIQDKPIPEVGTTTFRPPFVPVPLEMYHGTHRDQLFHPLKRLALERRHRDAGAAMGEYGGWLRPGWYGSKAPEGAVSDEVRAAREAVVVLDASPLGKIEVMGPDAESFADYVYYNTIKTLKPGFIRYGFMLTERGTVFDDGVISRLGPNRFVISCSSSHVDGVVRHLEGLRQDGPDPDRIFVQDTTYQWGTVTLAGPKAGKALAALGVDTDLSPEAFPHMSFRESTWDGVPLRIARVSFTGDVSFEISLPVAQSGALWDRVIEIVRPLNGRPIGIEAVSLLRAEKGYIITGKDTDGETMPHDLGFGVPRQKKKAAFVGDRSLHTDVANDPDRRVLVGLDVAKGAEMLPTGAHIVTEGERPRSLGFVTSSYESPTLGRPIAMALLEGGWDLMGQDVRLMHLGQTLTATVTGPCAFDPERERINA